MQKLRCPQCAWRALLREVRRSLKFIFNHGAF